MPIRQRTLFFSLLVGAVAAGASAGCAGPTPDPTGQTCGTTFDCGIDGFSSADVDGICIYPSAAATTGYCRKSCSSDDECPSGLCVSPGQCSIACSTDAQCWSGFFCNDISALDGSAVQACDLR